MPEWLYPAGPNSGLAFLFATLILGGLAALASGRALADTWRPVWQLPMYMLALAAAVRFVQFVVFGMTLLTVHGFSVDLAILTGLAVLGYRLTRRGQMQGQYGWLSPNPSGPTAGDQAQMRSRTRD